MGGGGEQKDWWERETRTVLENVASALEFPFSIFICPLFTCISALGHIRKKNQRTPSCGWVADGSRERGLHTAHRCEKRKEGCRSREDILIERLKAIIRTGRHATGEPTWRPQRNWSPVTEEELVQAETQLGFVLPSLLRRIYREVATEALVQDMDWCL